jgi:hypothetical protein
VLQVAHDQAAYEYQQEPRAEQVELHDVPGLALVRVLPGAEEGAKVLREPDEQGDQEKGHHCRHAPHDIPRPELERAPPKREEEHPAQGPAHVGEPAVQEEVQIDGRPDGEQYPRPRPARQAQVEKAPGLAHVAGHGGVHEPTVQGNAEHLRPRLFRVLPAAQSHFVQFKCQANQVEQRDHPQLADAFQARQVQEGLHQEATDQGEIVPVDSRDRYAAGQRQQEKDVCREQAGQGLLAAEVEQFDEGREQNPAK